MKERRNTVIALACIAAAVIGGMAMAPFTTHTDLGTSGHVLRVNGKVFDAEERPLDGVSVTVDTNGVRLADITADTKGRFNCDLDIGGFYGVTITRNGFVKKRFIIDTRSEDPAKVITGPFTAEVTLVPESDFADMDITDLYYPYAYVTYSKQDKSFQADAAYIEERQRAEAALRLGAARARKRAKP